MDNFKLALQYISDFEFLPIKCECILSNGVVIDTSVSSLDLMHEIYYYNSDMSVDSPESKRKILINFLEKYTIYLSTVINVKLTFSGSLTLYDERDQINFNREDIISFRVKEVFVTLNKLFDICKEDEELETILYNKDLFL